MAGAGGALGGAGGIAGGGGDPGGATGAGASDATSGGIGGRSGERRDEGCACRTTPRDGDLRWMMASLIGAGALACRRRSTRAQQRP
jgi:MYXO-CTERM domain-containing protein